MRICVHLQRGACCIDVDIKADARGISALCGPSGAGKSSIISMVAGILRPDKGYISLNGECVFDSAHGINLPPEKRHIGYVFQEGHLFPHLSVKSNLMYGQKRADSAVSRIDFAEVLDLLGIAPLLSRRPKNLSGGEKQRVALGRAILSHPRLLLMDEPLASLDAAKKEELLPFIRQLNTRFGIPVLYVSHSPDEIRALTDRVIRLSNGKIIDA